MRIVVQMCIRDRFIMDFMEMYAQKKMTAEQAASLVKSGDWVDYEEPRTV